eukprot:5130490-Alexandrium_andersonii.AAC.1
MLASVASDLQHQASSDPQFRRLQSHWARTDLQYRAHVAPMDPPSDHVLVGDDKMKKAMWVVPRQ